MSHTLPIMIDSGAYSAAQQGTEIDFDQYITFCHKVTEKCPEAVLVNLDIIYKGKESYENWIRMRREGLNALPVYHMGTDEKWLEKYLEDTDYVGLGGVAGATQKQRKMHMDRVWERYFIDLKTRLPKVKVHGMGVTSFPLMLRYPWYSVDSTAWLKVSMFGHILVPRRKNGTWDYTKPQKVGFSTQCGSLKDRGGHFENMTPPERKILLSYLKEKGFLLGFECEGENGKRVVLKGASTWHGSRSDLCLEFYASFLATVPWPRPFKPSRVPTGFGIDAGTPDLEEEMQSLNTKVETSRSQK